MNKKQQTFVNEMLRHGDKTKAYRIAYPDAKTDKAIESSVNRLMKNKEVKEAIDEPTTRLKAEAKAEVETELKERMKAELLTFHEAQVTLTNIIRGTHTTEKWVKNKDGWTTIEVKPTQSNIISALNTYFRLNGLYPQKKTAAMLKAEEQERRAATAKKWEPDPELKRIMAKAAANPYRHPWGDIYPPEYRGPWYDPNDPNTREQFLAITEPYRLSKLNRDLTDAADCPEKHNTCPEASGDSQHDSPAALRENTTTSILLPSLRGTKQSGPNTGESNAGLDCHVAEPPRNDVNLENAQQNTTIKAVMSNEAQRRETSPQPMQADRLERQDNTAAPQEISPYGRNDGFDSAQQNTTTHNTCPETSGNSQHLSPLGGAGGGDLEQQIAIKYKHVSDRVRQSLLTDALRKQGWQTIEDAFYMVNDVYLRNQHSGTIKMMKLFEKAKNARAYPPHLRLPIEKETGWTFHPKYPNMMRRTRALGW